MQYRDPRGVALGMKSRALDRQRLLSELKEVSCTLITFPLAAINFFISMSPRLTAFIIDRRKLSSAFGSRSHS